MVSLYNSFLTCFIGIIILVKVSSIDPRIIDINKAIKGQIPYQASLMLENEHKCGAAIINERHVVTAGTCVVTDDNLPQSVEKLKVVVGTITSSGSDGMPHSVDEIFLPDGYNTNPISADIAVLKIKGKFYIHQYVLPISIAQSVSNPSIGCTISGWNKQDVDPLYFGITKILDINICRNLMASNLAPDVLCAAYNMAGLDTRKAYKGAPLVCNYTLTGVGSYSHPDGTLEVYTDVYRYNKWISDIIGSSSTVPFAPLMITLIIFNILSILLF